MAQESSLTNHLLIAMPGMDDPNFSSTVTLVCEHNDDGALGIVSTRLLNINLGGLFDQLAVTEAAPKNAKSPVLSGGPVGFDNVSLCCTIRVRSTRIRLLYRIRSRSRCLATSSMQWPRARGRTSQSLALDHAGWEPGQAWKGGDAGEFLLMVPATAEIVFDTPFDERWAKAADSIGIDISKISPHAGHA